MKLQKHDSKTEMKMNMTPMIDVVFQLIIFFMVITDMTQQDLEDIQLPLAHSAVPDKPDPKVVRPIVNIDYEGRMVVKREEMYDPETEDLTKMQGYLADQARRMPKKPINENSPPGPNNPEVPDNPLMIRADRSTEFKYIQKVMELCGKKGIQIWKIEIGVAEPEEKAAEREGNQARR